MAELIPRRVLFGNPERVSPRISPNGTSLAWIAPHDGVLNVWTAPVGADGVDWDSATVVTSDTDRGIRVFRWAHDGRHLLYLQDTGGDENWRLYDVDLHTMQRRDLTPFEGVQAQILATEKKYPSEVLVGLNRDNPALHDVYRLDLVTGDMVKQVENPGFAGWVADTELVTRVGVGLEPDGSLVIKVRDGADGDWRLLQTLPAEDAMTSGADGDQRGRRLDAGDELGGRGHRPAGPRRPGQRRGGGAGRGPRRGRERRPGEPGHPGTADRHLGQGPHRVPGARPCPGGGPGGHPRAAPGRPGDRRAGSQRHGVAGGVHQRRRPGALLPVRPAAPRGPLPVRSPARTVPVRAGPDGAVLLPGAGRPDDPRVRDLPAGSGPLRAAHGAQRPRRAVGTGHVGLRLRGAVAREPRLPVRAGQLPRFHRLRQGVRQRR